MQGVLRLRGVAHIKGVIRLRGLAAMMDVEELRPFNMSLRCHRKMLSGKRRREDDDGAHLER